MGIEEIIGVTAGALSTGCLLPQIFKTHRTKSAADFSLIYLIALWSGIFLWLIYGILLKSFPIILANSISFVLVGYLLYARIKHA